MHGATEVHWNQDGCEISRIEIEILDSSQFLWTVYDEERPVMFATGDGGDVERMTHWTALLVGAMLGVSPEKIRGVPSLN
jgi:hypothetical protein